MPKLRRPVNSSLRLAGESSSQPRSLMQVREALKLAAARLTDLVGTLRVVGRNQRQTGREMRAVRGTLRHLRKIEL